jgi:hypothetical protein
MTFLEAAIEVLKQQRKPLHFKKLTELAVKMELLDHVGRAPETAMQTALANAIKKGQPALLLRESPGVFGLKHYPPPSVSAKPAAAAKTAKAGAGRGRAAAADAQAKPKRSRSGSRARNKKTIEMELPPEFVTNLPPPLPAETDVATKPVEVGDIVAEQPVAPQAAPVDEALAVTVEAPAMSNGPTSLRAPLPHGPEAGPALGDTDERKRRRRRRRRGRGGEGRFEGEGGQITPRPPGMPQPGMAGAGAPVPHAPPLGAQAPHAATSMAVVPAPRAERGNPLADAIYEILRNQPDGRALHVRQLTDMALARKLIRSDGPELWRSVRMALQQDIRDRIGQGLRPRIRFGGGALFSAADRRVEGEVLSVERSLAQQAEAVRRGTRQAVMRRLVRLPPTAFETVARMLLERLGFAGLETIKRTSEALYVSVARPRGAGEVRTLVAIRGGGEQGRRAVGELRAGVMAKSMADGLLVAAGRLLPDAAQEAGTAGPPVELWDGDHVAAHLIKLGVGVVRATLPVDYVDADFFADLTEG